MIGLIQRVSNARVDIEQKSVANIDHGIMALIGIEKPDTQATADKLLQRILTYRIFNDGEGKMSRSLLDVNGGLLLVPQFTLPADTKKGTRPGFSHAAPPAQGKLLFEYLVSQATRLHAETGSGIFAAHMQVTLTNDGPVTFWLKV